MTFDDFNEGNKVIMKYKESAFYNCIGVVIEKTSKVVRVQFPEEAVKGSTLSSIQAYYNADEFDNPYFLGLKPFPSKSRPPIVAW